MNDVDLEHDGDAGEALGERPGPRPLALCRACMQYVKPEEDDCPFCGVNLAEAALEHRIRLHAAREAAEELERALAEAGFDPRAAYHAFTR